MQSDILFADCEGNDFVDGITTLWTIQLADGVDGEVTVYTDHDPNLPPLSEGLDRMKAARKVAFHNAFGFDFFAINKLYPGTLKVSQIVDTLIIARMMDAGSFRASLADIGDALGFPKGHHTDFSKFSPEMVTYGARDVQVLQKAWVGDVKKRVRSFGNFYTKYQKAAELEFQTAYIIEKQRQHGFRLNMKKLQELEIALRSEQNQIERELQVVFPPIITPRYSEKQVDKTTGKPKRLKDGVEIFNPGSRPQIAQRLIDRYGWKPKNYTDTRKVKVDETILEELPYPEAKLIARYLTIGKQLGQITDGDNGWMKLAVKHPNGEYYVHGQVNTLGTRTTRMTHFKPNMGQVNKKEPRMREVWEADPGHDLVGVDAEGLELRMLAHFLFPYDDGFYSEVVHAGDKDKGTDIHTVNKNAAELNLRDSAKTMIYAHNYGCGDAKLGDILAEDARAVGKEPPKGSRTALGKKLRKTLEDGVKGLGKLIQKCKSSHQQYGSVPGLDGRRIKSASEHSALNTLLQGNGSIVMKKALCIFDDWIVERGWDDRVFYCANVHDEFQLSVHPSLSNEVAELGKQSIRQAGIELGVRCPLVGSADIGKNWKETH